MEKKSAKLRTVSLIYEEIIWSVEETTSGSGCGLSVAAFSRLASACPSGRVSRGVFLSLEGVKRYESKLHLPRLWNLFGL